MKQSNIQWENLEPPEYIFNKLGYKEFKENWNDDPLQILQDTKATKKNKDPKYLNDKFMAGVVYKKLVKYMNDPEVTKYVRSRDFDKPEIWSGQRCSLCRKTLMLIDQEICPERGPMDLNYYEFRIEEPKEDNPFISKKVGRPRKDIVALKSMLPEVIKHIKGKPTTSALTYAYEDYFNEKGMKNPPSRTSIGNHFSKEIKDLKGE